MLHKVQQAERENKLVCGLHDIKACATQRNSHLLLIEKDIINSLEQEDVTDHSFYIRTVIDYIIEKVLESGANIELVDNGLLEKYQRIVLIRDH